MTDPHTTALNTYTHEHVVAALGEDAAAKVRDYVEPPPVSPELRLARDLIADAVKFGMTTDFTSSVSEFRNGYADWSHLIVRAVALQRGHELDTPAQPQADADGWIPWPGGECPVALDSKPGVRFGDGQEFPSGVFDVGSLGRWQHECPHPYNIIAYKPEPGK